MLFNSREFIFLFLPVTLLVFFLLGRVENKKIAMMWLLSASLFFYGWWDFNYLALIIFSMLFNFGVGHILSRSVRNIRPKIILTMGVLANLAALGYYKYANFFISNVNIACSTDYRIEKIVLPLAISFFTFQQVAYLVDAYKGKTREYSFLQYCLFVVYFPQLVAGPIVHHYEIIPQFQKNVVYTFNSKNLSLGIAIFLIGLFKKIIIADGLSSYVTPVFTAAEHQVVITFFQSWSAALSYTFQLYFDFSGYSDMAIGIAKMFNIDLPLNFHSPYKSKNIIEFWRRWHMTLSRFLRDYLYIPLGGAYKGMLRKHLNLFITMLLGGLWHGANWTFVVWGCMHGSYLIINHFWQMIRTKLTFLQYSSILTSWLGTVVTFLAVVLAWVVFRADSFAGASNIVQGMLGLHGFILPEQIASIIPGMARFVSVTAADPLLGAGTTMGVVEMLGMICVSCVLVWFPATNEMTYFLRAAALMFGTYFIIQSILFSRAVSEFLYFQF